LAISVLVAVGAAALLSVAGRRHRLQGSFREAGRLWDAGDYREAIVLYQGIVDDFPGEEISHRAQYQIGMSYYLFLQKEREAIRTFRELVRRVPESPYSVKAQMHLGEIYEKRLGDYQQAIVEYQRLIHMSREGLQADEGQLAVARCYFHLGDIDQAREEYEVHLERFPESPNSARALSGIGNCYYVRRAYGSAIRYYRRVVDETEDGRLRTEAVFGIATSLEEAGELQQALEEFRRIAGDHPNPALVQRRIDRLRQKIDGNDTTDDRGGPEGE
jgi:TolA-binding protein